MSEIGRQFQVYGDRPTSSPALNAGRLNNRTVFEDLPRLRDLFGVFHLFGDQGKNDPDAWMNRMIVHLENNYSSPDDICSYLHSFLSGELKQWYFGLDVQKKKELATVRTEFVEKCFVIEREQHKLCDLDKDAFLAKLKVDRKSDKKLLKAIDEQPLLTFFKEKFIVFAKVHPLLDCLSVATKIIFQLKDDGLVRKFYPCRADRLTDILERAEFEDSNSPQTQT